MQGAYSRRPSKFMFGLKSVMCEVWVKGKARKVLREDGWCGLECQNFSLSNRKGSTDIRADDLTLQWDLYLNSPDYNVEDK